MTHGMAPMCIVRPAADSLLPGESPSGVFAFTSSDRAVAFLMDHQTTRWTIVGITSESAALVLADLHAAGATHVVLDPSGERGTGQTMTIADFARLLSL